MNPSLTGLARFFETSDAAIHVTLTRVRGSSPRDAGAEMYVSATGLFGTIGGGQLEHMAVQAARDMLRDGALYRDMDVPLGPEIGQCCGGRVELSLSRMRGSDKAAARQRMDAQDNDRPHVYVMGAGHVGRALARLLQHLPVRCILVDTRAAEIALCDAAVETRLSAIPEIDIWSAPAGSAFVVLTYDHALDFLLTSAALERGDAAYVGMIGSATKRAKFRNWVNTQCDGLGIDDLTCPIGAGGSDDKRPDVIAAFVVAEVVATLTATAAASAPRKAHRPPARGKPTDREGLSA
ncbi:xanthine dehydrogenase accessory protein XdhC [Meridianimarinicoccus sp. RP-17]|uniref:xanthine dehydrogenase accessory protein XdhC n=1 Tax=Meridianimarinicoccus zhengii TaxID=2056810 RepID=UPI000DAC151E|nr:xanthine dehydrogenase accessory protein XdhC [Phycocomes zhengii]